MLIKILSLRSLLPRRAVSQRTRGLFIQSLPWLYLDTSRPEESSTFPLQASVIQPSHCAPIHFSETSPQSSY